MICTGVIPCLSNDLAKNDKIKSMFVLFSRLLAILKVLLFFENGGTNLTPKQSSMIFKSIFERYNKKVAILKKKTFLFWLKNEDKPNGSYLSKVFSTTNFFIVIRLWLFGMFSGDKGDNIDMRMIKITIKVIKLIWMFGLFQK